MLVESDVEVTFQILKVATIGTTTLHYIICTRIGLEHYNNNDLHVHGVEFR